MTAAALPLSGRLSAQPNTNSAIIGDFKDKIIPISVQERKDRIAKAQSLMQKEKIGVFSYCLKLIF